MNNHDVRYYLYDVWNEIQMRWNDHLSTHTEIGIKNKAECHTCQRFYGSQVGVDCCIKKFGGKPRRTSFGTYA